MTYRIFNSNEPSPPLDRCSTDRQLTPLFFSCRLLTKLVFQSIDMGELRDPLIQPPPHTHSMLVLKNANLIQSVDMKQGVSKRLEAGKSSDFRENGSRLFFPPEKTYSFPSTHTLQKGSCKKATSLLHCTNNCLIKIEAKVT